MKTYDFPQNSPEWYAVRRGIPSASRFHQIATPAKGILAAAHTTLICELIAETLTDEPVQEPLTNYAIRRGNELEPEARRWLEFEADLDVQKVGFCTTDDGGLGCSPDGLIGDDGGLELKCPLPKTHVGYLLAGTLPDEYKPQVHGSLIVTGRSYWRFVSYCPGLPALNIVVEPDAYTQTLRDTLAEFLARYADARDRIARRVA